MIAKNNPVGEKMIWDRVAGIYDIYTYFINGKVNRKLCEEVEGLIDKGDRVLECACGTGLLSFGIAKNCKELIATDYSVKMLKQTQKKCGHLNNITIEEADIKNLQYESDSFDKVVAGNVIHLFENPIFILKELERVCRKGGKIIIPTYIGYDDYGKINVLVGILEKMGFSFSKKYNSESYKKIFVEAGYINPEFILIEGKIPCSIAIIEK